MTPFCRSDTERTRCSRKKARPILSSSSNSGVEGRLPTLDQGMKFNRNVSDFRKALMQQVLASRLLHAMLRDYHICVHQEMVYCKHCSEAWFNEKPANAERVGDFFVVDRCSVCTRSRGTAGTASHAQRFSVQNGMHPQPSPSHLPHLTEIEEALIALHAPVLRVFRLRGGQLGYGGSCVSLTQDVGAVARSLPRRMEGLDVVIFTKSVNSTEEGGEAVRKTFRVRRAVILAWLYFF